MAVVKKGWIPFVDVQCRDGRVRVYENSKTPYSEMAAKKAAKIMREENELIGADVVVAGIEKIR